jgi:hypothetical protein
VVSVGWELDRDEARAPLPEERAQNRIASAKLKRRKDRHDAWKVAKVAKRSWNDTRVKRM